VRRRRFVIEGHGAVARCKCNRHVSRAADDEILKNTFANNAFENFEIAAYKSLIVLAEAAGRGADVQALQMSLAEEQRMAQWVDANVENVTTAYLRHATIEA
jgi:ferritin-like metal-binding protein YciE